ncbi:MAG TPA: hypothetical protein VLT79_08100 [Gemmatimonadales bacterium]|nr:hypothetical protein [Gemmatimonadales bacterium]
MRNSDAMLRVRRLSFGLVLLGAAACTSVGPVDHPGSYIVSKQPRTIWLTKSNRSVIKVDGPRMLGDTVIGSVGGEYTEIPLTEVTRASVQQQDKGKTIAAAALGGAAVAGALVVIFKHSGSGSNSVNDQIADTMTLAHQF